MIRVKAEESSYILATYKFPEVAFDQPPSFYKNKNKLLRQIPLLETGEFFPIGFSDQEIAFIGKGTPLTSLIIERI